MKTDMMRGMGKGFSLLTLFCSLIPLLFDILFDIDRMYVVLVLFYSEGGSQSCS